MENVYSGTDTIVSGTGMMNAVTPLLSILTAGISGSARLHEKLGTAEALCAVDRCMKRIERVVEAFDGDLIKIGGDEMKAAFHTADAAVHAAIEMQQRIADLPPVSGVKLAIRVGISCGEGDALGSLVDDEATKEAALLTGQAKPAQILISGKIRELMSASLASQANEVELGASAPGGSVYEVLLPDAPSSLPSSVSESPAYTPTPTGTAAFACATEMTRSCSTRGRHSFAWGATQHVTWSSMTVAHRGITLRSKGGATRSSSLTGVLTELMS